MIKTHKQNIFQYIQQHILLFLVIVICITLRLWNLKWGLPEIYEEAMPLNISWKFWNWGNPGLDFNPHFFIYPAFPFYFQFVVQTIHFMVGYVIGAYPSLIEFQQAYLMDPTAFVVIARLITVLFDVGIILIMYQLAIRIADKKEAIITAALISINVLHLKQSHLINVDTVLTFFSVLSLLFIYEMYKNNSTKWYIWSGISIGLATAAKYNGALLLIVLVIAHMLKSVSIKAAINSLLSKPLFISILSSVATFFIFNPFIIIRFNEFLAAFTDTQKHMTYGHLGLDKDTSTIEYYLFQSLPSYFGWLFTSVIIISVIYWFIKREKKNYIPILFLIVFLGTLFTWEMRADRYIFPVIPVLIFIGVLGFVKLWDKYIQYINKSKILNATKSKFVTVSSGILISVIFISPMISSTLKYQRTHSSPDTRIMVKDWMVKNYPPLSSLAVGPFGLDFSKNNFFILPIPFNAVETEKTTPFYDIRWYENIDVVITSDYDYGRYLQEPVRFREILEFYDNVRKRWKLLNEVKPSEEQNGPSFWLYQPISNSSKKVFDQELIDKLLSIGDSTRIINFVGKLGLILSVKGEYQKSEQLLEVVLHIDPNNFLTHKELATIKYNLNKYEDALSEIKYCLGINPDDAELLANQGSILLALNRLDEAEKSLKEALKLNDRIESAYIDLNLIYGGRNDIKNLIDNLKSYKKILAPNSKNIQLVDQLLIKLQSGN